MNKRQKRRIYTVSSVLLGLSLSVGLALFALNRNINLYYTPSQAFCEKIVPGKLFRLGGVVKKGSVWHVPNSLNVNFELTDKRHSIPVHFRGILPALFHEGQGIVTQGRFNSKKIFIAEQVLAKHDERYYPPGIRDN